MPIDAMKIRQLCYDGIEAVKKNYPAMAEQAFLHIKIELKRAAAEPETQTALVRIARASPALYAWMHTCPWDELAAVLMASGEGNDEDAAFWLRAKREEWPKMFRDGLTEEHFGDCTKAPITCTRCVVEEYKAKIDAMREAVK